MTFEIQVSNTHTTVSVAKLKVSAEVRYWEDASVNGQEDVDGTLIPFRKGDLWEPIIDLATGKVDGWPQGTAAEIHYKVCDAGEYWLLDDGGKEVAKWAGYYVPDDFLCPGDNGYGDYIILEIDADGQIAKWRMPSIEPDDWIATHQANTEQSE